MASLGSASELASAASRSQLPEELVAVVAELLVQPSATVVVFPAERWGSASPDREAAWHLAQPG